MAIITPTITAENPHTYREQMERVEPFAKRVHIDLMDGIFTPNKSVSTDQVWLPESITSDIHVMFQNPETVLEKLASLRPDTIIIPAEADFDLKSVLGLLRDAGVKLGLAVLPKTSIESLRNTISELDHLLIFSGNLGYQGGSHADLELLEKVAKARARNPQIKISWDGGVNDSNVQTLAAAGVDIINVGGYIHAALDPGLAYKTLTELLP